MKEIKPEELNENPFKLIGKDWMLITAQKAERTNMMTASWGGVGILWNKPVATVYIRRSRFTKGFVDDGDTFSLCVMPEEYRKQLAYCGKASGRDDDKVSACGFKVAYAETDAAGTDAAPKVPYFEEARLVLVCKKLYAQEMAAQYFTKEGSSIPSQFYSDNDWHTTYVAEIVKVLIKE
jgi:flavin reductase (DIM6/NTAB) family NADH-FMN oxidoreductase RutF